MADDWIGLCGRLRVAVLRHSAAFDDAATLGTARSRGAGSLGCQYVTMGLGWPELLGWISGHST